MAAAASAAALFICTKRDGPRRRRSRVAGDRPATWRGHDPGRSFPQLAKASRRPLLPFRRALTVGCILLLGASDRGVAAGQTGAAGTDRGRPLAERHPARTDVPSSSASRGSDIPAIRCVRKCRELTSSWAGIPAWAGEEYQHPLAGARGGRQVPLRIPEERVRPARMRVLACLGPRWPLDWATPGAKPACERAGAGCRAKRTTVISSSASMCGAGQPADDSVGWRRP